MTLGFVAIIWCFVCLCIFMSMKSGDYDDGPALLYSVIFTTFAFILIFSVIRLAQLPVWSIKVF